MLLLRFLNPSVIWLLGFLGCCYAFAEVSKPHCYVDSGLFSVVSRVLLCGC